MSRCIMRAISAGPKGAYAIGDVFEGSQEEVDALVAGGFAELESEANLETATREAPEDATRPRRRRARHPAGE